MLLAALLFLSPLLTTSKPDLKAVQAGLNRTVKFAATAISPDGLRVAWVEHRSTRGAISRSSVIYAVELAHPATPVRISAATDDQPHSERDLAWSPDSRTLAFVSDAAQARHPQLYTVSFAGGHPGAPRQQTRVDGELAQPRFSPDGTSVSALFTEGGRAPGPTDAANVELGQVESHILEQRIAVVNLASHVWRVLSPADQFVYEYDWSPDGRQFAYTAAQGEGTNNWWIAKLYRLDVASGQTTLVTTPELQIAQPRWSPDGQTIAYIGGLMSDEGSVGGDIFLAPASGGPAKNVTPGRSSSAAWLCWQRSGGLLFGEDVDGGFAIAELNAQSRVAERLWQGDEALSDVSIAADGRTVSAVRSSYQTAPEVWAGRLGAWSSLSARNRELHPAWGRAEKLHWQSEGRTVDGWLLYPAGFDPAQRYPMVVSIHGGPAAQVAPAWPQRGYAVLASQGFFVFFPNPRGSYGQGETFTRANVKDFGHGDLTDILAGVDEVLRHAPVDANRLGVGGWSYGGFMTMWTVTQTNRFRAAVAGAGIANWQSYYGQNLIDRWMIPYFGASVYDDPAAYARSSPINYIKQAKTPALVVVGERDAECPAPQSREFWHALKAMGVKTDLVIYPNEGHAFRDPAHIDDLNSRTADWFIENLK